MMMRAGCVSLLFLLAVSVQGQTSSQAAPSAQQSVQAAASAQVAPAGQKIDPAKEADIRKLQELRGDRQNVDQAAASMGDSIRPLMTSSLPPGEYRDKLVELFFEKFQSKNLAQRILDQAVPVYDKYLSDDEIKGLIQFYESPLGRKLVAVTPSMTADMGSSGRQVGQELGRQSMMEVLMEHPDLAQAMEEASKASKPQ